MVMPELSTKIKDLFGFEFSDLLERTEEEESTKKKAIRNAPARAQVRKKEEHENEVAPIESGSRVERDIWSPSKA
jgi:hypothetical protein